MESESIKNLDGKAPVNLTNEIVVNNQPELDANHKNTTAHNEIGFHCGDNAVSGTSSVDMNTYSESSMEASISSDDMIRAGGFGARDDIGCFLPVASDFTDFEASLRDAQNYEDPREETGKPGLGWTEVQKQK